MPVEMRNRSKITATEIDKISGRIAQYLYPLSSVEITGFDTSTVTDFRAMVNYCYALTTVKTLDTSNSAYDLTIFNNTYALTDIEFRPNRIRKYIAFPVSAGLTNASLVSIANGLSEDVTGMELKLNSTSYGKVVAITGTYQTVYEEYDNYDIFTADVEPVQGHTTLEEFITTVKNWGIVV